MLFLTQNGYDGAVLYIEVKEVKKDCLTVPHSKEQIDMIVKATTHGQLLCTTRDAHLTSNDMLAAFEAKIKEGEIKKLEQSEKEQQFQKSVHSKVMKS